MEITSLRQILPKSTVRTIPFHFPVYVAIPFYLFVVLLAITFCCILLGKREAPPDPFSAYAYLLLGQLDATMDCRDVYNMDDGPALQECSIYPEGGPFFKVSTIMGNGSFWVNFAVRDRAVMVGDLAQLWGIPAVRFTERMMILSWPGRGISAWTAIPPSGRFDYFLTPSVVHIWNIRTMQQTETQEEHQRPF